MVRCCLLRVYVDRAAFLKKPVALLAAVAGYTSVLADHPGYCYFCKGL